MKKIIGLKKAVKEYKEINAGGAYSMLYGYLMYNVGTGELWTSEFCDLGHNSYIVYDNDDIINLGAMMTNKEIPVTMANVKAFIATL